MTKLFGHVMKSQVAHHRIHNDQQHHQQQQQLSATSNALTRDDKIEQLVVKEINETKKMTTPRSPGRFSKPSVLFSTSSPRAGSPRAGLLAKIGFKLRNNVFSFLVFIVFVLSTLFRFRTPTDGDLIINHELSSYNNKKYNGLNNGPSFSSGVPAYDDAFELALREVAMNIASGDEDTTATNTAEFQPNSAQSTFVAGAGWTQLWTRDTSYALELSLALLYPDISLKTIKAVTQKHDKFGTTWYQDKCGDFGGWPNLTDAIVGAQGSWSLYLAAGDIKILEWAYKVTTNTLKWAESEVYDQRSGLFKGCSSFMESNSGYPKEYSHNGDLVGKTKALSTNVLYYNGYRIAADMGRELSRRLDNNKRRTDDDTTTSDRSITELSNKATNLKQAIRSRLWMEEKGYYSYFEDATGSSLAPQMEGLGESLLLLAEKLEHNDTRIKQIFQNTHRTDKGLPCLWPRFEGHKVKTKNTATYYHNGRIWPFVQGYWALAAARHKQITVFAEELDRLVELALRQSSLSQYNKGLGTKSSDATFAEYYEIDGTFLDERRRQLWSSAGYLGMIIQGLFGIQLEPQGIRFRPVKPKNFGGLGGDEKNVILKGIPYRQATLTIKISGYGSKVKRFTINGKHQKGDPFVSKDAKGNQDIEIKLKEE